MKNFKFNNIYIIESLKVTERHTGKELYNDLIAHMPFIHKELKVAYKSLDTLAEWDQLMDDILQECKQKDNIPILHLEIHGEPNGKGLVTTFGELITLEHVGEQFRAINMATGCNLFITLGVCKGLYLLFNMHMDRPMPFVGAVGSFEDIYESDIYLRYYEFYDTFFRTLDIGKAYVALQNANSNMPTYYRYIPADEIFYKCYQEYLNNQCTKVELERRAKESVTTINGINRQGRREFEKRFIKDEKRNRGKFFRKHTAIFFMTDNIPENTERFDVPKSFEELRQRYEEIVML